MNPAPVALFVYNRLWHTQQTIASLQQNTLAGETELIVFSDGPKRKEDTEKVDAVRTYIRSIKGFKSIIIKESGNNKGLANSIISGVGTVLDDSATVIVLEDDMLTSPYFLDYMNRALVLYQDDDAVISIHGYIYPVKESLPDTFFLRGADCWGWATWRRGWNLFRSEGKELLMELEQTGTTQEFDFLGAYPYTKMLKEQIKGANDSWAIRWYASAFLAGKLTLYPGKSLVNNIGNDSSGTHSWDQKRFAAEVNLERVELKKIPIHEDRQTRMLIANYFRKGAPSLFRKIFNRLKSFSIA